MKRTRDGNPKAETRTLVALRGQIAIGGSPSSLAGFAAHLELYFRWSGFSDAPVVVVLLYDVAQMNADAELDAAILWHPSIAFDHRVLHFNGAADGVHHAAELDKRSVAGALHDAPAMRAYGGIDQIGPQPSQSGQSTIFVGAGEPGVADHIGCQDSCDLSGLGHDDRQIAVQVS